MKYLLAALIAGFLGLASLLPASAQEVNVVTSCGSMAPFGTLTAGTQDYQTVDVHGQLCLTSSVGGGGGGGGYLVDPTAAFHCAGTNAATTGSIVSGSNALTLAAGGFAVGQGVYVAGAGVSGAPLVSTVSGVSGLNLTLATVASTTVSGAAVLHDDTACLRSALNSGSPIHLGIGNYNVSDVINVAQPATLIGDGAWASIIWNTGTTNDIFDISYNESILDASVMPMKSALFKDFSIKQTPGIVPTAGYAFNIGGTSYLSDLHIDRVSMHHLWGGMYTGVGVLTDWFTNLSIRYMAGRGIYIDTPSPSGDMHFDAVELYGPHTGVTINQADASEFTNLKLNGTPFLFTGNGSNLFHIRVLNASIEGPFDYGPIPLCGIDFGPNGTNNVSFIGGEIALWGNSPGICNAEKNIGGIISNMVYQYNVVNMGPFAAPPTDGGGSCPMVTPPTSATAYTGSFVAGACSGGTIYLYGMTQVQNGYNCSTANRTHPDSSHLVIQNASFQNGVQFTANTVANDVIQYTCWAY